MIPDRYDRSDPKNPKPYDLDADMRTSTVIEVNTMNSTEARILSARLSYIDIKLKSAIFKAAEKSREILNRRIIVQGDKSDTLANRVGYFVNSIRREMWVYITEMQLASKTSEWTGLINFLRKLEDTRQWSDIAVPTENPFLWSFSIVLDGITWGMSMSRIKEIVMDALQVYTDPLLQTTIKVKTDLAELERGMVVMYESLNIAKRINEEADNVVVSLSDLVATLPQEN